MSIAFLKSFVKTKVKKCENDDPMGCQVISHITRHHLMMHILNMSKTSTLFFEMSEMEGKGAIVLSLIIHSFIHSFIHVPTITIG